jgi:hypothetical protein
MDFRMIPKSFILFIGNKDFYKLNTAWPGNILTVSKRSILYSPQGPAGCSWKGEVLDYHADAGKLPHVPAPSVQEPIAASLEARYVYCLIGQAKVPCTPGRAPAAVYLTSGLEDPTIRILGSLWTGSRS